jgi:hypothetical protein
MTLSLLSSMNACLGQDESQQVKTALDRASHFMMDTVSLKGGFLMLYSEDLSRRWGELPARDSMVWVQDPATVGVGELFLRAHQVTGVPEYLRFAKQAAAVLIYGQHPSGGWDYFIDFDPAGTSEWYDRVGSRCWGWEEYYHYYGNCTFDDTVTVDASRFLLHLYLETLDPTYRGPVLQSLRFLLESQYPNGAWPQRFPLDPEELLDRKWGTPLITPLTMG